jgi:hypothetical protein
MIFFLLASSRLREYGRLGGGVGRPAPPLLICAEAMIAGDDPSVDLADQETVAAAGGAPPAPETGPLLSASRILNCRRREDGGATGQRESGLRCYPYRQ